MMGKGLNWIQKMYKGGVEDDAKVSVLSIRVNGNAFYHSKEMRRASWGEGDKFHLGHHEFEVTDIKHYTVGYTSPEIRKEVLN